MQPDKLTPREYAKLRDISPQLLYYYIKQNVLILEYCACGRKILDVSQTDKILSEVSRVELKGVEL